MVDVSNFLSMFIFSQLLGYSRFDLLGTSGYDYIHTDDLLQVAESHTQRYFIYHILAQIKFWKIFSEREIVKLMV